MPHDCKGRLVEVGDIVRGKGYNVKHEISGPVISVTPGSASCNITVGYVATQKPHHDGRGHPILSGHGTVLTTFDGENRGLVLATVGTEYGQADAFEIVQKHDGSIPVDARDTAEA